MAAQPYIIRIRNLDVVYGDKTVLKSINLDIRAGELVCFVGTHLE